LEIDEAEKLRIAPDGESKKAGTVIKGFNPDAANNPYCTACGQQLGGDTIGFSGSSYHPGCFKCALCGCTLINQTRCLTLLGKPVRLFPSR